MIGRESLVWHAHEREGGAWQGGRCSATPTGVADQAGDVAGERVEPLRHNGMGVPVVTAPLGATPAQIVEAQRLASAHRGGDRSRRRSPRPGSSWSSRGITGVGADPLPFINYLDQQMCPARRSPASSTSATPATEPRLGDTFVDLLVLSLQAVADDVADVWTADVAADLIRLSYGDQEPSPSSPSGTSGSP